MILCLPKIHPRVVVDIPPKTNDSIAR